MATIKKGSKVLFSLVTFILLFSINSCDLIYSPDSEHLVDVPTPTAKMSIDLTTGGDTVFVNGEVDFNFNINTDGKVFSHINVFVDSTLSGKTLSQSRFTFQSPTFQDGLHKLSIEVWVHSGNGSLADRLNSEYIINHREWYLYIDNHSFLNKFTIDSIYSENGTLSIKWPQFPYNNFVSYTLYRERFDADGNSYGAIPISIIKEREICTAQDTTYGGGIVKYFLEIKTNNESYKSPEKLFQDDNISSIISITKLDMDSVKIVISKIKYYKNIKKFYLCRNYDNGDTYSPLSHTSLADTVFIDAPGFGLGFSYNILFWGDYGQIGQSALKSYDNGTHIPYFTGMQYITQTNSFYFYSQYQTERWDALSMTSQAKGSGKILVSSAGSYAFESNYNLTYDPYPHTFTKVNPLTLQKDGNTIITDNYTGYYSANDKFSVSETGLLAYVSFRYNGGSYLQGPGAILLFDYNLPGVIAKDSTVKTINYEVQFSKLTDEGEYFIPAGSEYLFNINGRTLKKCGLISYGNACFTPSGKEYVVATYYPRTISIYRCRDGSLIKSFPVAEELYSPMIDPVTGLFGAYAMADSKYKIYNLTSETLVKQILLHNYYSNFYLYNSTLFSSSGYYLKLSQFKERFN
jgi:hypothetical protein